MRARNVLRVYAVLHLLGAGFAIAQFLFFPERVVDLVPDAIPLDKVRHVLALFAVLPATFIAWDIVLLLGLARGDRRALLVGYIAGGAGVLGALIHAAYGRSREPVSPVDAPRHPSSHGYHGCPRVPRVSGDPPDTAPQRGP